MKSIIAAVLALVALAAIVTTIPVNAQFNGCGPGLCNGIGGSSVTSYVSFSSSAGVVSANNGYITFSADDVLLASAPFTANVLIVGGGAGGGTGCGGGAGRAQLFANVQFGTATPIKLGLGGAGSTNTLASGAGTASYVWPNLAAATALVSTGGAGSAAGLNVKGPAWLAGSGSGACSSNSGGPYTGGTGEGLTNENAGGGLNTVASPFASGGGGGAGSAGTTVTVAGHAGAGGNGVSLTIASLTATYAGGGGGSCYSNGGVTCTPAAGGSGGGGAGATSGTGIGGNGTVGTGGGGGGGYAVDTGGNGANGVIIIAPVGGVVPTWGTKTIQPTASAVVLPTTTNLAGFYSVIQLTGWAGNCLNVTRSSDSTTLAIGFVNNVCDWESADAFAAATNSTLTVNTIYDQSGSGNDLTCTGTASAAFGLPTFSSLNAQNLIRPISIEGQSANSTISFQKCSNITITGNTNAVSTYLIAAPKTALDFQGYWTLQNSGLTAFYSSLYHIQNVPLQFVQAGLTTESTGLYETATLQAISTSSSGTLGQIVRANGAQYTNATNSTSNAFGAITLGLSNNGFNISAIYDLFAFAIYNVSHTSTQMASIEAAMTTSLPIQTTWTNQVVYGGNSLVTGYDSYANQTAWWQAGFGKGAGGPLSSWKPYILGEGGTTLATDYSSTKSIYASLYDATKTTNVVVIRDPTNDISLGSCTSQANCQAQADTLFTGTTVPLVQYLLTGCGGACGSGFNKVVVPTSIARSAFTTANYLEYWRLEYNSDVVANAATYGYTVSDRANATAGGAPAGAYNTPAVAADPTRYFTGGTHLNNLGYLPFGLTDRFAIAGF